MGCHIWFSVPYTTDKSEILKLAQQSIDNDKYFSDSEKEMYQYAIDKELKDPVCNLVMCFVDAREYHDWIIYADVTKYSLIEYNKEHGTNYASIYEPDVYGKIGLESYSDEPRIGGYPDNVIHSYDEMIEFMKTGFDKEDGKHYDFNYDETRIEKVMDGIKSFFIKHPDGIITFG